MNTHHRVPSASFAFLSVLLGSFLTPAMFAQGYPKIPHDIQAVTDARKAAADKRSDEIFARELPEIEAWAAKGKPYIPSASAPGDLPQAKIPAFPGAEGGGMYSFGGRGGKVFVVTNLNDDGPGSFREACEAAGPRIVVFNVSGIIHLKNKIRVRAPYITIAGNTAPGDGICIAGDTVELEGHDIVVRYMRFRRGETDATDRNDSFGGNPVGNLMIDHVSASWGLDENMSMYRHMYQPADGSKELKLPTVNVTIQNSIFSEGLNTYHHAFGSTIGGLNSTFHHNVWACNTGRNPSVGMYGDFTFANNIIFNYRHRTVDGGDQRSFFNIINNYYKPGPGTPDNAVRYRILKPESERNKNVKDHFGKAYVSGNIVEGNERVTKDNWDGGVQPEVRESKLADVLAAIRVDTPFKHAPITIYPAETAFKYDLANAGATLPARDPVDQRVLNMVQTGVVGKAVASPEDSAKAAAVGYAPKWVKELEDLVKLGFITDPAQVGGYPKYEGTPYVDSDHDGMPDNWETEHGLNPHDASDADGDLNGDGYTNIEDFINGLDPRAPKVDWTDLKNNVDHRNVAVK
jgi:hypothetical protein